MCNCLVEFGSKTGKIHASVAISGASAGNGEFSEIMITANSVDNYFKARRRAFNVCYVHNGPNFILLYSGTIRKNELCILDSFFCEIKKV